MLEVFFKINKRVVPNKAMLAGFFWEINRRVDMLIKATRVVCISAKITNSNEKS